MRATILTNKGFEFRQVEIPECKDNMVLIRMISCGVCEGDVYAFKQAISGDLKQEILPGHEGTGVIEMTRLMAGRFNKGDIVTVNGGRLLGNYSEYFLVDADDVFVLPANVDTSLVHGEPAACCVHGMRRSSIDLRSRVAVLGCGYMGMVCLQLALMQGAREVVVVDPIEWRLNDAIGLGASKAYIPEEVIPDDLGEFDVVIEAAGVSQTLDMAIEIVKQHGKILVFGAHHSEGGFRNLNMFLLNFKAVDLINAHVRRDDEKMDALAESVELMTDGRLDMTKLVTPYPIYEINTVMYDLISRKEGLYKASVCF